MSFSKRFKELREKKGLSQEAIAEKLKIPRSSVTHYENSDDRVPRQKRLNEIADFFGVSVDYLIGRSDTEELTIKEEHFLQDIDKLSIEELKEKHVLTIDGKPATKEEIEATIAFIRSLRSLK
ncbi:helix-turn-helix domain-containing protein [Metabacillus sp. Hm71]|uniref:helix-turn-helix domain-containing protein n=1 Tax=Metabacillus sp. Hm71 TaxID=3450743 RepID=UPI003F423D4E